MDVARDAMQMYSSGADVKTIRRNIEEKYKKQFPTMTPTPPVYGGQ
jgi:hypothetical protein